MNRGRGHRRLQAAGLAGRLHEVPRQQGAPAAARPPARSSSRARPSRSWWPRSGASLHEAPPIGAQIQIKGGLAKGGLAYADAVAARAVQVFVGNPRGWKLTAGDPDAGRAVPRGLRRARASRRSSTRRYLVNVGSPTEATVEQSIASIAHNLAPRRASSAAGASSSTPGRPSARTAYEAALRQLHERLLPVLDAAAGRRAAAADRADRRRREVAGRDRSRTSAPTWRRWRTTRWSASASTPATPGRPGTTWPPRAG